MGGGGRKDCAFGHSVPEQCSFVKWGVLPSQTWKGKRECLVALCRALLHPAGCGNEIGLNFFWLASENYSQWCFSHRETHTYIEKNKNQNKFGGGEGQVSKKQKLLKISPPAQKSWEGEGVPHTHRQCCSHFVSRSLRWQGQRVQPKRALAWMWRSKGIPVQWHPGSSTQRRQNGEGSLEFVMDRYLLLTVGCEKLLVYSFAAVFSVWRSQQLKILFYRPHKHAIQLG